VSDDRDDGALESSWEVFSSGCRPREKGRERWENAGKRSEKEEKGGLKMSSGSG